MKFLNKFCSFISVFLLLFQQVAAPLAVLAQESTQSGTVQSEETTPSPSPSQTPAPTVEPSPTPSPELSPIPSVSSTPEVTVEPSATPASTPTPSPEVTPSPTDSLAGQPNAPPSPTPSAITTSSPTPIQSGPTPTPEATQSAVLSATVVKHEVSTPDLKLDLSFGNQTSSATLTTDKADYSPTDTAIISGSGFAKETAYTLEITSSDPPAVNFQTQVTTDGKGSFVYSYQLDGNYRPNYKVEVKDSTDTIVASTTFTDSAGVITSNGTGGGAWTTGSTWIGGVVPAATDAVIIASGDTVTTGGNQTSAGITINGTLSMASGNVLTVNGDVSGTGVWATGTTGNTIRTISLTGSWSFNGTTSGSKDIGATLTGTNDQALSGNIQNGGSGSSTLTINKTSGSVTLGNALTVNIFTLTAGTFDPGTFLLTAGTRTFTAGTLRVGATTWAGNYSGAITQPAAGLIEYDAAGAQTVNDVAYPGHLTISGSGTKTWTLAAARTITGNLTVGNGATLTTTGNNTLGVSGVTSVTGSFNLGGTSTKTFTGNVTVNSGGVWNETGVASFSFAGNLQNDGTFTANTGTHTFSGAAKTLSGSSPISIPTITFSGNYTNNGTLTVDTLLTVSGGGTVILTNNGTITASSALSGTDGVTQGTNGILNIGGTSTIATLTATAVGNTVNYTGAAQTVKAIAYRNLIFSGSGAKSMATGTSVTGNLSIAPTGTATASIGAGLNLNVNSLTLGGVDKAPGTWGGTGSGATHINTTYFAATTGKLTVATGDSTAPTVALTYSANPAKMGVMTITATYSEAIVGTPAISIDQPGTTDISGAAMTGGPTIWTYSYTVNAANGGTYVDGTATVSLSTVTDPAENNAGSPSGTTFTVDTTAPSGSSISYTDGYYTTASVPLTVSDGTDLGSGINTSSRIVQRQSATLSNGTCGAFSSWSAITPSGSYPNFTDTTVSSGNCYQYKYLVSDNVSNQATYTSTNIAKIDTELPTTSGTPSTSPNPTSSTTQNWNWSAATDAISGIAQYAWRAVLGATTVNGTTATNSTSTNLLEGIWNFFVKAVDNAGNQSSETQGSVTVDTTPPVANDQNVSTNEDTAKDITLSAADVNGDNLTYTIVSNPSNGTLSGAGSQRTYTPNANYNGSDSFTFKANDGTNDSNTATVTIAVSSVNDVPSFDAISDQSVYENSSSQNVSITNVSPGPADESGQTVIMSATSSNTALIPNPTIAGSGSTRTLTFAPVAGNSGTATITVTADDQQAQNNAFSRTFNVTVVALASISGMKFKDVDGNGSKDSGDSGLSSWTINLSGDSSATATTDSSGNYSFTNLIPGTYQVCEVLKSGWVQTAPNSGYGCGDGLFGYQLTLSAGENVTGENFGNFNYGQISGKKYDDVNENGEDDNGEPGLSGWTIYIDANNNGQLDGEEISTTTDSSGNYTFSNLGPGTYTIREVLQDGWKQTDPTSADSSIGGQDDGSYVVTMTSNGNKTQRNFGNFHLGTISGYKFDDTNGDGVWNDEEYGLEDWTIFLDANNNGVLDEGEVSTTTDSDGYFEFSGLEAGTYKVREVPAGWVQTTGNPSDIVVTSGTNVSGIDFGNFQKITITGRKFEDKDANASYDDSLDSVLSGWSIFIDANGNGVLDEGERVATTADDGSYSFDNLGPGTYKIREAQQNGWTQTTSNPADIVAESGHEVTGIDFGNFKKVIITGYKWKDLNADGVLDKDESGIGGWNMSLSKVTTTTASTTNPDGGTPITTEMTSLSLVSTLPTDSSGQVNFEVSQPGTYRLTEESQDNFQKTYPTDSFFDVFVEVSGQTTEGQTSITQDKNGHILRFGNAPFQQLDGAKFVPTSGDGGSTTSIVVLGDSTISVSSGGGTSSVSLPGNTVITRSDGSSIDVSQISAQSPAISSLTGFDSNMVVDGALQWGIPNLGLSFSQAITLNIFVGADLNGQTLSVVRSSNGTSGWTSDGIVAPATCVVASGICTFQATKASYYATTHTSSTTSSTSTSTSSTSGGDGGDGLGCAVHDCSVKSAAVQNQISAILSQPGGAAGFAQGILGITSNEQTGGNLGIGQVEGISTPSAAQQEPAITLQPQAETGKGAFPVKTALVVVIVLLLGFGLFRLLIK